MRIVRRRGRRIALIGIGLLGALLPVEPAPAGSHPVALGLRWRAPCAGAPEAVLADAAGVVAVGRRGELTALDRAGRDLWSRTVGGPDTSILSDRPALGAGLLVVPVDEAELVVIDRRDGRQLWARPLESVRAAAIGRARDGAVLVAAATRANVVHVMDAVTGEPRWSLALPDAQAEGNTPPDMWFRAGELVMHWLTEGKGSRLFVVDAATGKLAWEHRLPGLSTAPAVSASSVTFAENLRRDGEVISVIVRSLALRDGVPRWERRFSSRGLFLSTVAGDAGDDEVVVIDHLGTMLTYEAADGSLRWRRATERRQYEAHPHIVGQLVAMTTYGTGVLAFDAQSGQPVDVSDLGETQTSVTIEGSAAVRDRLYLLIGSTGAQTGQCDVWGYAASKSH